jgi:hypothetical protein
MEVTAQVGRDHPVDLKRVVLSSPGLPGTFEQLLTFLPARFQGTAVKVCFVGRGDVTFLRADARNDKPSASREPNASRFTNLAITLRPGDVVKVGPDLLDLKLISVGRGSAVFGLTLRAHDLLLNLEPMSDALHLDLHAMIDRLNRGEDYRSDAL